MIFQLIWVKHVFAVIELVSDIVELLLEGIQILFHSAVPVVFDAVVRSAGEYFCDVSPPTAVDEIVKEQDPLLVFWQLSLIDRRVQVVVPTFSALLPDTSRQVRSDQRPFVRPVFRNQRFHQYVFLKRPRL